MKKLKIYLSGTTTAKEYRKFCKETYCELYEFIDPMELFEIRPDYIKIVEKEIEELESADLVVAWVKHPTFGTTMEIKHAFDLGIPVYIIHPNRIFEDDIWLKYHCDLMFNSIEECFKYIEIQMKEGNKIKRILRRRESWFTDQGDIFPKLKKELRQDF